MGVATGPGATALIARRDWPPRGIAAGHGRGDRARSHGSDRETGLAAAGDCGGAWAWRQAGCPCPAEEIERGGLSMSTAAQNAEKPDNLSVLVAAPPSKLVAEDLGVV